MNSSLGSESAQDTSEWTLEDVKRQGQISAAAITARFLLAKHDEVFVCPSLEIEQTKDEVTEEHAAILAQMVGCGMPPDVPTAIFARTPAPAPTPTPTSITTLGPQAAIHTTDSSSTSSEEEGYTSIEIPVPADFEWEDLESLGLGLSVEDLEIDPTNYMDHTFEVFGPDGELITEHEDLPEEVKEAMRIALAEKIEREEEVMRQAIAMGVLGTK